MKTAKTKIRRVTVSLDATLADLWDELAERAGLDRSKLLGRLLGAFRDGSAELVDKKYTQSGLPPGAATVLLGWTTQVVALLERPPANGECYTDEEFEEQFEEWREVCARILACRPVLQAYGAKLLAGGAVDTTQKLVMITLV